MTSAPIDAAAVAARLGGHRSGSGWDVRCPCHDDKAASLSVTDRDGGGLLVCCHAGCSQEEVIAALKGMELWPSSRVNGRARSNIVATYDYHGEDGKLVYQTVRYVPKRFRQRSPARGGDDPAKVHDGWFWSTEGRRKVPYRLADLTEGTAVKATVWITEGEKDADHLAAAGLVATTNASGGTNWTKEHSRYLHGAAVVILEDNDDTGRKRTAKIAASLAGIAASVKVVRFPELPEHGDVSDWLDRGGTVDRLLELASEAAEEQVPNTAATKAASKPGELPPCSDEAIALDFAERHKDDLRYTYVWGRWHHFAGGRWQEDDTLLALDRARALCREAAPKAANAGERKDTVSAKKRAAVASLAREDRRLAATAGQWDANIWLLTTPRGSIDLQTLEEREHRAGDYITRRTAVAPGGTCPRWRQFIREITDEDRSLAEFLQRVAGYVLTGDTSAHALFFGHGGGGNGKSVFISTLAGILGDYHRVAPIETFTASMGERHPTELAMLRGARLVTSVETEEGRRWAEGRVKTLTGGDPIAARFMRQDFFEYTPQFKLLIVGNYKPSLRNVDEAIRRRFHLIPFNVTIPAERRDPALLDKLEEEWPGILQWALDGLADWHEHGLAPPEAVAKATAAYLEAEDDVAAWIAECCERAGEDSLARLNASWRQWAERNGLSPRNNKWLSQALEARGCTPRKSMTGLQISGLRVAVNAVLL